AGSRDSLLSGGTYADKEVTSVNQAKNSIPQLPFKLNSLRFTFSATAYEEPDKMQYQYFLEGYDPNWSTWTQANQKEYTNLLEGKYTFHVRGRDIFNQASSETTYTFTISPPWYRTIWAYIFYVLLAILLLLLLKKFIKQREIKERVRLQQEQEKALKLQEAQHAEQVLKAEKEIIKLNNEKLENELFHKNKELASSAMHVTQSLDSIQRLKDQLQDTMIRINDGEALHQMRKLLRSVEEEINFENNWEQFEIHFNQIHQDFIKRLRVEYPQLTHRDIKLCTYLRLNLSSKEIASLLNLSIRGVETSRYRIRKKMNLEQDINLTEFILKY
ncbi:MAG: LuxR C-terminal-related transcriptional regulator, partial [Bacteroidota bacterium]|nr:LuxR C-terminal-related transcriptional regulator [Bacteroidota bacterium]